MRSSLERHATSAWRLPLLSGVLFGLTYFAPVPLTHFLALVPLLIWVEHRASTPSRGMWLGGLLCGLTAHLISLHWINVMAKWSPLAHLLYVLFALLLGVRTMFAVRLLIRLRKRTRLAFALLLPAVWIPFEWAMSFGDLRMTTDHIGNTLGRFPFLIQWLDLVGPYGSSWLLLAANGALADLLYASRRRRILVAIAGVAAVLLLYDTYRWFVVPEPVGTKRVGFVQPNVPLDEKWEADKTAGEQLDTLYRLSREVVADGAELVVWPESARPLSLQHWLVRPDSYAMPDLQTLARELDVAFLVGVEYLRIRSPEDFELYNAAIGVEADGTLDPDWIAKKYLVPFTEALPFRAIFEDFFEGKSGDWMLMAGQFRPGPSRVVTLDGVRLGVLVCYEQLFADLPRALTASGAELQIVITNDAWFGRSLFQRFNVDALRMRAIENRRAFVRAANTGISGFVDSRGRYTERTALFEEDRRTADVALREGLTLYARTGDVAAYLALLALFGLLLSTGRGSRSSSPS